jgi:hypothetical protein
MRSSRENRAIAAAVRCYSSRWRSRHGDDATLLASALLKDGVPWWSIALNFLGGATRERITRMPNRRFATTLVAVVVGIVAVPLTFFASLAPASASSVNVVIGISNPVDAARQLESGFSSHHFKISVTEKVVPARLVGSIVSASANVTLDSNGRIIGERRGPCVGGSFGCIDGLVLPLHFSGVARVTIGLASPLKEVNGR